MEFVKFEAQQCCMSVNKRQRTLFTNRKYVNMQDERILSSSYVWLQLSLQSSEIADIFSRNNYQIISYYTIKYAPDANVRIFGHCVNDSTSLFVHRQSNT